MCKELIELYVYLTKLLTTYTHTPMTEIAQLYLRWRTTKELLKREWLYCISYQTKAVEIMLTGMHIIWQEFIHGSSFISLCWFLIDLINRFLFEGKL